MPPFIPNELLEQIIQFMAADRSASLTNVARVNTACCDMVRAIRFENVRLDYEARALRFVAILALDMIQQQNGSTRLPMIGSYIRRLNIAHEFSGWGDGIGLPDSDLLDFDWWLEKIGSARNISHEGCTWSRALSQRGDDIMHVCDTLRSLRNVDFLFFEDEHADMVLDCLISTMRLGMPRLSTLAWDRIPADPRLWCNLSDCLYQVKDLTLDISGEQWMHLETIPATLPFTSLDLRSDYMTIEPEEQGYENAVASYKKSIMATLKACASTIQELSLHLMPWGPQDGLESLEELIEFPALCKLRIRDLGFAEGIRRSLLTSPVRHLSLWNRRVPKANSSWFFVQHFPFQAGIANMPELRSINLDSVDTSWTADLIQFLFDHRHLKHLSLEDCRIQELDGKIVPLLAGGLFSSLTSLSLTWHQPHGRQRFTPRTIAPASLASIGQISTLEHLKLSVIQREGNGPCSCEWEVDHDKLRELLDGLTKLKILILEGANTGMRTPSQYNLFWAPPFDVHQYEPKGRMYGWLKDMVDLRARPELDDWRFDKLTYSTAPCPKTTVWRPDQDMDREGVSRWVSMLDRYCWLQVKEGDWYWEGDEYSHLYNIVGRNRALDEAEKYASAFPHLKMVYMWRQLMKIREPGSGHHGNAVPVFERPGSFAETWFKVENGLLDGWDGTIEGLTMKEGWPSGRFQRRGLDIEQDSR